MLAAHSVKCIGMFTIPFLMSSVTLAGISISPLLELALTISLLIIPYSLASSVLISINPVLTSLSKVLHLLVIAA